jgi:hypothetical protein
MATNLVYGVSKRGQKTLIHNNYEFWRLKDNSNGETLWRCSKHQIFKCKAMLKTANDRIAGRTDPDHTHSGNVSTALARQAIGKMKSLMTENIATPSASQGAVVVKELR